MITHLHGSCEEGGPRYLSGVDQLIAFGQLLVQVALERQQLRGRVPHAATIAKEHHKHLSRNTSVAAAFLHAGEAIRLSFTSYRYAVRIFNKAG